MRTDDISDCDLEHRRFGRRGSSEASAITAPSTLANDIRLFALTFAAGFLFVTVYLA